MPIISASKPGGFDGAPSSIDTCLVLFGFARDAFLVRALPLERDDDGVAGLDDAGLDRFVTRRALAQPLERLRHGFVFDRDRGLGRLDRAEVARIETRHDVERGLEGEGLALFEHQVLDVGRVDRLDAAFGQRLADRPGDEVLGDVLHDLAAEALADDRGRHLAGPEAGDARLASEPGGGVADRLVHDRYWGLPP